MAGRMHQGHPIYVWLLVVSLVLSILVNLKHLSQESGTP